MKTSICFLWVALGLSLTASGCRKDDGHGFGSGRFRDVNVVGRWRVAYVEEKVRIRGVFVDSAKSTIAHARTQYHMDPGGKLWHKRLQSNVAVEGSWQLYNDRLTLYFGGTTESTLGAETKGYRVEDIRPDPVSGISQIVLTYTHLIYSSKEQMPTPDLGDFVGFGDIPDITPTGRGVGGVAVVLDGSQNREVTTRIDGMPIGDSDEIIPVFIIGKVILERYFDSAPI